MSYRLPHCQHEDGRDPAVVVREFLADPEAEEAYLAVSNSFYELEDQDHYEATYAAYESAFDRIATELKAFLGAPTFEGNWEDPEYPEFAVGERVVVWQEPETVYLRLHHGDREVPILIVFARVEGGT